MRRWLVTHTGTGGRALTFEYASFFRGNARYDLEVATLPAGHTVRLLKVARKTSIIREHTAPVAQPFTLEHTP